MKICKSMLTMLLCSGLIIAVGLTACGDDDDEAPQVTCEQALDQFQSADCQEQASDHVGGLKTCAVACPEGDLDCVDACLADFEDEIPACLPAISIMFESCNACWTACADTFVDCLLGANSGADCLTALNTCVSTCP